jgi:hypothetical protein
VPTTATPPITSEWPFMYLVVECTTMSMPSSSGRWLIGLAKVLSHTLRMPRARHSAAMACRSASFSIGLVGVSTHTIFVSGRSAPASASGSVRST